MKRAIFIWILFVVIVAGFTQYASNHDHHHETDLEISTLSNALQVQPVIYLRNWDEFDSATDQNGVVVIELWAQWNKDNAYPGWELEDCLYYRADIEELPGIIEDYQVVSIPTVLFYKDGILAIRDDGDATFKAGHDISHLQEHVDKLNQE